jgi:glycosyltransferase involved in cell wall biosynthesis
LSQASFLVARRSLQGLLGVAKRTKGCLSWSFKFELISMTTTITKSPRISIGVAVYNGERFLPQTLTSLLAQTYRDFELIICDNCSDDRTEQICRSYSERDARIRYHRNTVNIGAPRNFNRAFELSQGEYFKWSGADDLCAPEMIERCVAVLDQRPEVVLAYAKTRLIDETGAAVKDYDDRLNLQFEAPHKRLSHLLWNICMCNPVFGLIRSGVMKRVGCFGTYPNSDLVFLATLALHGRFVEIPERLFLRRFHALSVQRYPSAHQRIVMFDPTKVGRLTFPNWKLFAAHLSAIHRAPLSWMEKLRCYSKMHIWLRRRGGDLGIDLQFAAKYLLARPSQRRLLGEVGTDSKAPAIAGREDGAVSTKR